MSATLETHPGFDRLLDFYLASKREFRASSGDVNDRPMTQGWRASSLGKCLQVQYRERMGETPTRPIDAKALRAFAWGDELHRMVTTIYSRLGLAVMPADGREFSLASPERGITGHVDLITC